jgi:hypothetical protein
MVLGTSNEDCDRDPRNRWRGFPYPTAHVSITMSKRNKTWRMIDENIGHGIDDLAISVSE